MGWIIALGAFALLIGFGVFFGAPYVPSKRREIRMMFDTLHPLSKNDVVLDIGCGDGVVLREVSGRGVRAIGIEINPFFAMLAKLLSLHDRNVTVSLANFWTMKFPSETTFVYAFAVQRDGPRLEKKMQREASRLGRALTMVCLGSPLPNEKPVATFRAYFKYTFQPLQPREP